MCVYVHLREGDMPLGKSDDEVPRSCCVLSARMGSVERGYRRSTGSSTRRRVEATQRPKRFY